MRSWSVASGWETGTDGTVDAIERPRPTDRYGGVVPSMAAAKRSSAVASYGSST